MQSSLDKMKSIGSIVAGFLIIVIQRIIFFFQHLSIALHPIQYELNCLMNYVPLCWGGGAYTPQW